jgi:hypothetical protein
MGNKQERRYRYLSALVGAVALAQAGVASALEFEIADTTVKFENLITIGATWRMQDRDSSLIGKSNLNPGICVSRVSGGTPMGGPDPDRDVNAYEGNTCNPGEDDTSGGGFANANDFYVAQPGSYSPNGDNGNLNFDKHDLVQATAKVTTDINFDLFGFNVFARSLYFFDEVYADLDEKHPDRTFQAARTRYPGKARASNGTDFRFLDYFVSRSFEIGDRTASIKIGDHVLNWGESGFLALNSLNSINPPNQVLLRFPGSDIKEVFQPQGMVSFNVDVFDGVGLELFYQYEWKPIIVDPVGSFFSSSDTLGDGGSYAMASFGKAPEDPDELYQPWRNPDDPASLLGSRSDRTFTRNFEEERRRRPDDGGQYGASVKFFLEDLNNGTEVGLYFANYHSRVPSVSAIAADATCIPDSPYDSLPGPLAGVAQGLINAANGAGLGGLVGTLTAPTDLLLNVVGLVNPLGCGVPVGNLVGALAGVAGLPAPPLAPATGARDPLPVGSLQLIAEYPEDIRMYGISFNTTLGDIAWSGEYAYRENLPVQIHTTDVIFAGLQPAFPANDFSLAPIATLPGRRTAVPDFISQYRGIDIGPGDYVRGYERLKVGQLGTTFLKTVGGDNPLGATQITLLLELGMTHVIDMPGLDELQFNGAGTDTHISAGADGSTGINPIDIRSNPNDPTSINTDPLLRQNPTAHRDRGGFGTDISYGYRFVTLTRYDDAIFGINIELLNALFHDVEGVAPGLGQNFVEGRKQILSGIRWDYLSKYTGEVRYTWFTGGMNRDQNRDRDNILVYLGYLF